MRQDVGGRGRGVVVIVASQVNADLLANIRLSVFDQRYLKKFLATVLFEAWSVLDHSCFFFTDVFSTKISFKAAVDQKTCV